MLFIHRFSWGVYRTLWGREGVSCIWKTSVDCLISSGPWLNLGDNVDSWASKSVMDLDWIEVIRPCSHIRGWTWNRFDRESYVFSRNSFVQIEDFYLFVIYFIYLLSVGGQWLLTFRNKLRDVATYFLTVSDFFLLFHCDGTIGHSMVVTRISSSDRTTCKGHIKSLNKYIFPHCLLDTRVFPLKPKFHHYLFYISLRSILPIFEFRRLQEIFGPFDGEILEMTRSIEERISSRNVSFD